MNRFVLLDTSVLGLLYLRDGVEPGVSCRAWVKQRIRAGDIVVVPEPCEFEARRELIRRGAEVQLARLDQALAGLVLVGVDRGVWLEAARLWARARNAGQPTASPDRLDFDVLLAAVARTIGGEGDATVVATSNVGHLARFGIEARNWQVIQ
jgi:predicted nucleic acid-binding protein